MAGFNGDGLAPAQPVPIEGDVLADIEMCYSCHGKHGKVKCVRYSKENPPFTHYFLCPTTGDPVGAAMYMSDNTPQQVHARIMKDVFEHQGRPFVMAMLRVTNDGAVHCVLHRHFMRVDEHLHSAMVAEFSRLLRDTSPLLKKPDGPLPAASDNVLSLFGKLPPGVTRITEASPEEVAALEKIRQCPPVAEAACAIADPLTNGETPPSFAEDSTGDDDDESDDERE